MNTTILEKAAVYVKEFFNSNSSEGLYFHNLEHTEEIVSNAELLCRAINITDDEKEIVLISAWFHDIGYLIKYEDHENSSIQIAEDFLRKNSYPDDKIEVVKKCILATKLPQSASNLLEEILCDADLAGLGKKDFLDKTIHLKNEWTEKKNIKQSSREYFKKTLSFMEEHGYFTHFAQRSFNKRKKRNMKRLRELIELDISPSMNDVAVNDTNNEGRLLDTRPPDRGVETMFRNNLRGHLQLSAIADNKANIMLSINAIIISIILSTLFVNIAGKLNYLVPTIMLLLVCVATMIFATLSTMPKFTGSTITRTDIDSKKANLLFFGNFHKMDVDDFEWGMKEMMNDKEYLYGSMIRDFYFLGKVLYRKYRYLRICYLVFIYGLATTVISYILAYFISAN